MIAAQAGGELVRLLIKGIEYDGRTGPPVPCFCPPV